VRMNDAIGKQILALVRDADFAHAGEVEAIELALGPIVKQADRTVLDAGCGRAGTAQYVHEHGWGRVSGFDIDATSIDAARTRYPALDLRVADAATADAVFAPTSFDLVYACNAFYAFPDQAASLRALRRLARPGGALVLFDYVDRGGFRDSSFGSREDVAHWQPIRLETFDDALAEAGWRLAAVEPLHDAYVRWYAAFVRRIDERRAEVVELAGEETFGAVRELYAAMHDAIVTGVLGGAIVRATA
jgi:SAM-dependent methyltransferase